MQPNQLDKPYEDLIAEKARIERLAQLVRRIVKVLAWLLASAFAFLKLRGVPMPALESGLAGSVIFSISMVVYYLSWCFGAPWDSRYEQRVIVIAPNKGRLTLDGILLMVLLTVLFGILCYVNTQNLFFWFLLAFWMVNWGGWRVLVKKFLLEAFRASVLVYSKEEKYFEIVRLDLVKDYIDGRWQWIRFVYGAILIATFLIINYFEVPEIIARTTGKLSADVIRSIYVAMFVFTVEPWVWFMRLRNSVAFGCVKELEQKYSIRPTNSA